MLNSICFNTITVVRQSNKAQDQVQVPEAGSPTLTISNQPKIATSLSFVFSERSTGSVTINGFLDGNAQTETVSISDNKICQSMKQFDQIDTIDFDSGLTTPRPFVKIKYIGMAGSSVPVETSLIDGYPINLSRKSAKLIIDEEGSIQSEMITGMIPYSDQWTPKEFDLFTIKETSEQFVVVGVPTINQIGINTHWVCNLKRYERS